MNEWDEISTPAQNWDEFSTRIPAKGAVPQTDDPLGRKALAESFVRPEYRGMLPKWAEEIYGGAGRALTKYGLGAKSAFTDLSPEEQHALDASKAYVDQASPVARGSEFATEVIAPEVALGPLVKGGGKLLTKAIPKLEKVANAGGKVFNLGATGRAATEGAILGGVVPPEEGETRLGNAAQGGFFSSLIPAAGATGARTRQFITENVIPTAKGTSSRANKVLKKTLGEEGYGDLSSQLTNAPPSRLPQTTAARTNNPDIAGLEKTSRERGLVDYSKHDTEVIRDAWYRLLDDTSGGGNVTELEKRVSDLQTDLKDILKSKIDTTNKQSLKVQFDDAIEKATAELDAAKATQGVRSTYLNERGVTPTGIKRFDIGSEKIPYVTDPNLRGALTKYGKNLDPQVHADLENITDELLRHEIYKSPVAGTKELELGSQRGLVASLLNATPLWRLKAPAAQAMSKMDKAVLHKIDEALLDPEKMQALINSDALRNAPYSTKEKVMRALLTGQGRAIGAEQGE